MRYHIIPKHAAGKELLKWMIDVGMTREKFTELTKVTSSELSRWLGGHRQFPGRGLSAMKEMGVPSELLRLLECEVFIPSRCRSCPHHPSNSNGVAA